MAASSSQVEKKIQLLLAELLDTEVSLSAASGCLARVLGNILTSSYELSHDQSSALTGMADYLGKIAQGGRILEDEVFQKIDLEALNEGGFAEILDRFNELMKTPGSSFIAHIVNCGVMTANNPLYLDVFVDDFWFMRPCTDPMELDRESLATQSRGKDIVLRYKSNFYYFDGENIVRLDQLNPQFALDFKLLNSVFSRLKKADQTMELADSNTSELVRRVSGGQKTRQRALLETIEQDYQLEARASKLEKFCNDSFHSLFSMPVQRVMRYSMLLIALEDNISDKDLKESAASLKRKAIRFANTINEFMKMFVDPLKNKTKLLDLQVDLFAALSGRMESDAKKSETLDPIDLAQMRRSVSDQSMNTDVIDTTEIYPKINNLIISDEKLDTGVLETALSKVNLSSHAYIERPIVERPIVSAALALFNHKNVNGMLNELADADWKVEFYKIHREEYVKACQELYRGVTDESCMGLFDSIAERANNTTFDHLDWDKRLDPGSMRLEIFRSNFVDSHAELAQDNEHQIGGACGFFNDKAVTNTGWDVSDLPESSGSPLKTALLEKIAHYLEWRDNKGGDDHGRGYKLGLFTRARHFTDFGKNRAIGLRDQLGVASTDEQAMLVLQGHLSRYSKLHNHSLDTYLLEAVKGEVGLSKAERESARENVMIPPISI